MAVLQLTCMFSSLSQTHYSFPSSCLALFPESLLRLHRFKISISQHSSSCKWMKSQLKMVGAKREFRFHTGELEVWWGPGISWWPKSSCSPLLWVSLVLGNQSVRGGKGLVNSCFLTKSYLLKTPSRKDSPSPTVSTNKSLGIEFNLF